MTRPLRPAPIVASAVLLIVVGSELILAGIAGVGWLVLSGVNGCVCCGAWLFAFGCVIGIQFLTTGIDALTGDLEDPARASKPVLVVGGVAAIVSLLTLGCGLWATLGRKFEWAAMTRDEGMIVSGLLLLWSNTTGLLTAGFLLQNHAHSYRRWRAAIRRLPENAGYEPDVEE